MPARGQRVTGLAAATLLGLTLTLLVGSAPMTLARFTTSIGAGASFGTGSLEPPTTLTAAVTGPLVTLAWTPTASTQATGYDVLRSAISGTGYAVVAAVSPGTAATTTDGPTAGTWHYVLRSSLGSWRSAFSNEASAEVTGETSGFADCSGEAADTGGDNDGYEGTPANACAEDGAVAEDVRGGTNNVVSCTDAGKDRHRFWGYAFGLPAAAASIDGIEVDLVAGMSNNGGTTTICVELSADAGATWTSPKQTSLTATTLGTYSLGGASDTWGRAWTVADLDPALFRVRLTDVTSQPNKTIRLDAVRVRVNHTP